MEPADQQALARRTQDGVGFALGASVAVCATYAQWLINWEGSLVSSAQWPAIGLTLGFGAMGGDALKSLVSARGSRSVLRSFLVFNAMQVDAWSFPVPAEEDRTEKLQKVDRFIESLKAEIVYGTNMAYYSKRLDGIHMPIVANLSTGRPEQRPKGSIRFCSTSTSIGLGTQSGFIESFLDGSAIAPTQWRS